MPINLGPLINTSEIEKDPDISADGSTLYFSSRRLGGPGFWDIWQVPIRQTSVDLIRGDTLLLWAEKLVEAEFGKGVISQEKQDSISE
jgi:hypothetical protein